MTAETYLHSQLTNLKLDNIGASQEKDSLEDRIFKVVMSGKFRKYSANAILKDHIKNAIRSNVASYQPINVTFLHGAYKLWRLEEAPEPDWAELFALMYYTHWLKTICAIYEPGVWLDLYVDDLIIPKLTNISLADVETYITVYYGVVTFLSLYQPANFKTTITRVGDQFESPEAFERSLQLNLERMASEIQGGLPHLTEKQKASVEFNARPTIEQQNDPLWREKIFLLHNAYLRTKIDAGYHLGRPEKILAFTQPLSSGTTISVGSTKDSVMKFWVGAGVLKPRDDSYRQIILSPNQLQNINYRTEGVTITGLKSKNFTSIRILT